MSNRCLRGKIARHADEKAVRAAPVYRPSSQTDRLFAELRGDEGSTQPEVEVRHTPADFGSRGTRLSRPPPPPGARARGVEAAGQHGQPRTGCQRRQSAVL